MSPLLRFFATAFCAILLAIRSASAQTPLETITRPVEGRLVHVASTDKTGGNGDMRRIAPGETFTLLDFSGAGELRRFWLTIAPRNNRFLHRQLILRCYWDGETTPSVEVPVGDFFGVGFGEGRDFQSAPLAVTSGGYNCYWPMPFGKSARITVENRSRVVCDAFYYNIDLLAKAKPDVSPPLYFHAQFRRTVSVAGQPITFLETSGRGHYVGSVLSAQPVNGGGLGYLEGDERVFVDGETAPSVVGTGTEDYFSSGWYFDHGPYSALYHGCVLKEDGRGRISAYRWHIPDPIPFTKSLRFTLEHGGTNDAPNVDYCTVAFWYQTHPHAPFPPLPADLLPIDLGTKTPGFLEGEGFVADARATNGPVSVQDMASFDGPNGTWSGGAQLWWKPTIPDARLTFTIQAPKAGDYELLGAWTAAPDYGNVRVSVNGAPISDFAGYASAVVHRGPDKIGRVHLNAGANTIVLEVTGKDARSTGYLVGLDGLLLRP